ncbi:MAG: carboxypeptidase-like regulatory domain-containing protein, partial [Gammaproteobacteria bacterium]
MQASCKKHALRHALATITLVVAGCGQEAAQQASTPSPETAPEPAASNDNISGTVTGPNGPEAGVWVIAETSDLPTRYLKIVVTNDEGRFLIPDLPDAGYEVWVRGYGLDDSAKVPAAPGTQDLALTATIAASPASAAQVYPAAYWYSMMNLPTEEEVANINGGMNAYLMQMKNMGCVGCHQLGQLATRTIPAAFNGLDSSH